MREPTNFVITEATGVLVKPSDLTAGRAAPAARDSTIRRTKPAGAPRVDVSRIVREAVSQIVVPELSAAVARSHETVQVVESEFDKRVRQLREVIHNGGSIKEAYIGLTGDTRVTGLASNCDRTRLREAANALGIAESLSTSSWAAVVTSAISQKVLELYRTRDLFDVWRKVARIGSPIRDFKTQTRLRIGGYGNLPSVNQGAAYLPLTSPPDEAVTYSLSKRGGTEDLTLELIANDNAQAVMEIPKRLAMSAKRTLSELVLDQIRSNATAHDGVALYHASHNNLFTAALSAVEYGVHFAAMQKQPELGSGKRLGLAPAFLLVPFDLEETAVNAFTQGPENEQKFMTRRRPEVVPVWYWSDANDWATFAHPDQCATLEVGFLDGKEEPDIFTQDSPTTGSLFSNDKITLKIRHIYGYTILDWRGTTKAVVA